MHSQNIRSIVETGGSYLISLPMFWVKSAGLKRKDKVELKINSKGELIVRPSNGIQD